MEMFELVVVMYKANHPPFHNTEKNSIETRVTVMKEEKNIVKLESKTKGNKMNQQSGPEVKDTLLISQKQKWNGYQKGKNK